MQQLLSTRAGKLPRSRVFVASLRRVIYGQPLLNKLSLVLWLGLASKHEGVPVVHAATGETHWMTHRELREACQSCRDNDPYPGAVRYPYCVYTTNLLLYKTLSFFYHFLFGVAIDTALLLTGRKPT